MRTFMQEYGRAILAAIIGSISIGICYAYLTSHVFRAKENTAEDIVISSGDEPVIVAPKIIRINVGDSSYDALSHSEQRKSQIYQQIYENYLGFITAYEDSKAETLCTNVTVAGIEQVDVSKPGRYQVIYRVENKKGRTFDKVVQVIVR